MRGAPAATTAPADRPPSNGKIYVRENWPHNTQQVFCDGKPLTQIAGYVGEGYVQEAWEGRKGKGLADLEAGSFYYDRGAQRLYLWLPGGEAPAQHVVEVQVRSIGISTCDLNYYDIAGFKVTHAAVGMGGSFGSHNTLENMEVAYADFCGISVGGSFNTLIHCKSNHNGNTGISTYNRGHRVVDCEVRFNNRRRWSAGWHAGGMKNFSSDTVVSGCVAEGNVESPGIWFDGSNTGVTIENCRCFRNGLGIMYEIGERAIIKNNICYENTGRGIYISNSAYCSIVHNLCYRNGMSGHRRDRRGARGRDGRRRGDHVHARPLQRRLGQHPGGQLLSRPGDQGLGGPAGTDPARRADQVRTQAMSPTTTSSTARPAEAFPSGGTGAR